MDELAPLPAPEAVLNKLKSDGTFDQFRKSCLAAIEAEVGLHSNPRVYQRAPIVYDEVFAAEDFFLIRKNNI